LPQPVDVWRRYVLLRLPSILLQPRRGRRRPGSLLRGSAPAGGLVGQVVRSWPRAVTGVALFAAGFLLFAWCVTLFARIGRGTLAPWDPTRSLVAAGPYRHIRNPMITGWP
jgi:protein-S-isoprenylcysteine O-methyltransferase Ste14